ncbi:hypothetical protein like AT1G40390 [Hibiscus trionum]|uniref:Uncharacterized protein n=1 Tax=Hibiscus trionum TaxID=183268 RepID=A0A9W7LWK6_HIBTR|nr:hypothetical protein like AT1G40390 [Hibiscus trionum]
MNTLAELVDNSGLVDLPLKGSKFMWSNCRESSTMCRLDCILTSPHILQLIPRLVLQVLPKSISDHNPLFLFIDGFKSGPKSFKFFNYCMENTNFNNMILASLSKSKGSGIGLILRKSKVAIKA